MAKMKIKFTSLPLRCEICHQADRFDPDKSYCSRCNATDVAMINRDFFRYNIFSRSNSSNWRYWFWLSFVVIFGISFTGGSIIYYWLEALLRSSPVAYQYGALNYVSEHPLQYIAVVCLPHALLTTIAAFKMNQRILYSGRQHRYIVLLLVASITISSVLGGVLWMCHDVLADQNLAYDHSVSSTQQPARVIIGGILGLMLGPVVLATSYPLNIIGYMTGHIITNQAFKILPRLIQPDENRLPLPKLTLLRVGSFVFISTFTTILSFAVSGYTALPFWLITTAGLLVLMEIALRLNGQPFWTSSAKEHRVLKERNLFAKLIVAIPLLAIGIMLGTVLYCLFLIPR
ncbi:MAG: hypothetical protein AB1489_29570 [Acidobacteriota bacterium]